MEVSAGFVSPPGVWTAVFSCVLTGRPSECLCPDLLFLRGRPSDWGGLTCTPSLRLRLQPELLQVST